MKHRELEGVGALLIDGESHPIQFSLTVVDLQGISASGDLTGDLALLMMAKQAKSCHLVFAGGEYRLKVVVTRHPHGHPAEFKVEGEIPEALRP